MSKSILFFGASSLGLIQLRLDLMKDCQKLGCRVIACTPLDIHADKVKTELKCLNIEFVGIKLKKAGLNVFSDLIVLKDFYRILKTQKPGIAYLYNIKPVIYGSIIAKFAGTRQIYSTITGLGSTFLGDGLRMMAVSTLIRFLYKFALAFNTKVFFQNPDDLSFFVTEGILPKKKAVLVNGSGVDLNYYALALLPKKIAFIMVARLIKDKGVHEYIEACKILRNKHPKAIFYLVGNLDANPSSLTQEELNCLVNEKIITYIDGTADIRLALNRAAVFVLPSYREGTSRATLEAMAMGRPIITTDVPGCRETVIEGVNGYLVPVKDTVPLAKAMEKFIVDPRLAAKMGKESRRIAEEKYDVKKVNKAILKAMELEVV